MTRRSRRAARELHGQATAPPSAFRQLLVARQRYLRASAELAAAGDRGSALDAVRRANAISASCSGDRAHERSSARGRWESGPWHVSYAATTSRKGSCCYAAQAEDGKQFDVEARRWGGAAPIEGTAGGYRLGDLLVDPLAEDDLEAVPGRRPRAGAKPVAHCPRPSGPGSHR